MSSTDNNVKEVVNILSDDDNECSIECLETVDLSGDNSTVQPSGTTVVDTVVLDEEDNIDINVNIKLRMTNLAGSSAKKESCHNCDSKTLRIDTLNLDNMLLCEVIELCLQLENSPFMVRTLKNNVLKWYQQANMEYRKSKRFNRLLMNTKRCLKNNPQCKYSYIVMMCDNLKLHTSQKNKAQLVTLATSLNDFNKKRTHLNNSQNSPKKQKTVLIDLDSEEKTSNVINLDEYKFDVAIVDNNMSKHQGKENKTEVIDLDCIETNNTNKNGNDVFLIPKPTDHIVDSDLRNDAMDALTDEEIIKMKEMQIVKYRNMIEELEKQEVDDDTFESPYIKCEKGRKWVKDNLGWNPAQVQEEARRLFVQCGEALQKKRQHREWRDLMRWVKSEEADADPADQDAALRARLEANRKIGAKNEAELIRRYSMIQSTKPEDKVIDNSDTLRVNKETFISSRHEKEPSFRDSSVISNKAECSKVSVSIKPGRKVPIKSDTICVNSKSPVLSDEKLSMQDSSVLSDAGNSSKVSQAAEFKGKLQDNLVTLDVNSEPVISIENKPVISIEDTEKILNRDSNVIPDAGNSSKVSEVTELKGKLQDNLVTLDVNSEPVISIENEPVISIEDTEKIIIRDSSVIPDAGNSSKVSEVTELKDKLQDHLVTLNMNSEPVISIEDTEKIIIRDSSVIPDAGNHKGKLQDNSVTLDVSSAPVISIEDTEKIIIRDSSVIPDAGNSSIVSEVTELKGKLQDNLVTLDVSSAPVISIEDTEKIIIRNSSVVPDAGNSSKVSQVTELKGKLQDTSQTLGEPIISMKDKEKSIIRDSSVILDAGNTNEVSLMCEIGTVPNIKIKEEPVENLMQKFQEFGDNFTTEILDIEDPFLVIEISSDSSSSDEEELG